jgi:hypothetical protein
MEKAFMFQKVKGKVKKMFSPTYTIVDVKLKLENDFSYFDYLSDTAFENGLTSVAEDVQRIYFLPRISQERYDKIKDKDKVDLTPWENALYWAEVYTICTEFLKWRAAKSAQLQSNSESTLKVEGYSFQSSAGGGASGADLSLRFYKDKMYAYWKYAGFDLMALMRTCTIFGDSPSYLAEDK